jgi:hypothetical protein
LADPLRDGRLCLSTVVEVEKVLTEENRTSVVPRFFRLSRQEAKEIVAASGAEDQTYVEMKGAPHYLEGHRPAAMAAVTEWLQHRYP